MGFLVRKFSHIWCNSESTSELRQLRHLCCAVDNFDFDFLKYCPEKYKEKMLKQQDINSDTPLHLLISHGCFIPELIKHKGLDTMAKNKNNFTHRDMLYVKMMLLPIRYILKLHLMVSKLINQFGSFGLKEHTLLSPALSTPRYRSFGTSQFSLLLHGLLRGNSSSSCYCLKLGAFTDHYDSCI